MYIQLEHKFLRNIQTSGNMFLCCYITFTFFFQNYSNSAIWRKLKSSDDFDPDSRCLFEIVPHSQLGKI